MARRPTWHANTRRRQRSQQSHQDSSRVPALTLTALALVAALMFVAATPVSARAASKSEAQFETPDTTFPPDGQGLYESCNPAAQGCLADLDTMAQGGFQLVLNYSQFAPNASLQDEIAYAQHANDVGLKILWPMYQFVFADGRGRTLAPAYPALDASFSPPGACPGYNGTNYGFVVCFVHFVKSLPATWGYYIGDELPAAHEKSARPLVDAVYDTDSSHPRLYVATSATTAANHTDLAAYARSYCDGFECHSDATVIAQDFYPIGSSPADQIASQTSAIAAGVQALAQQYHVAYGMVLQAHSLAQYSSLYRKCTSVSACPYPSQQQMLAMRDAALAHPTPQLLLWYSYFDLLRSDNFAQHWSDLQTAANLGKPTVLQAGSLPPAPQAPPQPTSTPTPQPSRLHPDVLNATTTKTTASGDVLTPFGRFNGTALEALAQLALLFVLIAAVRVAIVRATTGRPHR